MVPNKLRACSQAHYSQDKTQIADILISFTLSFIIYCFSSQTNEFLRECQLESDFKMTSKLTEREKKQAALPILVFGNELVEKFYSKHYCDKEDGLNRLKEELLAYDNNKMHAPNKTARAAIFLLHRALRDKVFSVYNLANEVIRLFFVQFVPGR